MVNTYLNGVTITKTSYPSNAKKGEKEVNKIAHDKLNGTKQPIKTIKVST